MLPAIARLPKQANHNEYDLITRILLESLGDRVVTVKELASVFGDLRVFERATAALGNPRSYNARQGVYHKTMDVLLKLERIGYARREAGKGTWRLNVEVIRADQFKEIQRAKEKMLDGAAQQIARFGGLAVVAFQGIDHEIETKALIEANQAQLKSQPINLMQAALNGPDSLGASQEAPRTGKTKLKITKGLAGSR